MHIPDGFLPPSIYISGYAITGGTTWYCLRQIKRDHHYQLQIPKASLLTAAFFVASLIHIPIPPTSIHLIFNGLMGIILGYYAFPAILIGLFFQAVMFGHGGLSSLGINAVMMGIPAILAHYLFNLHHSFANKNSVSTAIVSFLAGFGALGIAALIFSSIMISYISPDLDVQAEKTAIYASMIAYTIQATIEGIVTVMLVSFLSKVKPEMLEENS